MIAARHSVFSGRDRRCGRTGRDSVLLSVAAEYGLSL